MNDLLSDLQADLAVPAAAGAPAPVLPVPVLPLPTAPPARTTPAFELRVTPLRWALPGLQSDGGVCLCVGPLQVGVTRRQAGAAGPAAGGAAGPAAGVTGAAVSAVRPPGTRAS